MGKIKIELPNESFFVEIEGDQPNIKERLAINELVQSKTRPATARRQVSPQQAQEEQGLDTKTGIQSGMLRAALSAAETILPQLHRQRGPLPAQPQHPGMRASPAWWRAGQFLYTLEVLAWLRWHAHDPSGSCQPRHSKAERACVAQTTAS